MNKDLVQAIVVILERLKKQGFPKDTKNGLCCEVELFTSAEAKSILQECFKAWPKFSGSLSYPVPSVTHGLTPRDEYTCASGFDMWSKDEPYGALRWELVDHCIAYLKEQLK